MLFSTKPLQTRKRNCFVVINPKTSAKTEWGEFEVRTKCVNFSVKHMRYADNMNTKKQDSGQRTNTRACSCSMPIFDKNFRVRSPSPLYTPWVLLNSIALASRSRIILYSRINVYPRRYHILWIHSLHFAFRIMLCTRTVTFFHKILHTLGVRQMCGIL